MCAKHLQKFNDGLILCNTIRMRDSFECLCRFYEEEMSKKRADDEHVIQITETERFLFHLFQGTDGLLQRRDCKTVPGSGELYSQ